MVPEQEGLGGGPGLAAAAARHHDGDASDAASVHILANIGDMPVGTCRMRVLGESADSTGAPQAWALEKLAIRQRYQRR